MKYYIKKYQEPSLPLNKNYPTEITDLFMLGKYKEFEKAKKAYDDYYGKVLNEIVVDASKTTPTKTSNWTSEHNVAEDNKKYEQAHQAGSLKIASDVNHKMHEVGNSIGSTALVIGSSFTPLWMIAPAVQTGLDISKGNYADAALTAGLSLAAPYALGKYVIPGVAKGIKYLDDAAIKTITPYRNYRVASEFGKGVLKTTLKAPLAGEIPEEHLITNYSNPVTTTLKASLRFLEKPSKLTEAERLGIPKGGKVPYTPEENIAFRNQINEFAKKYGYNTIGDEVTDPEVLEKYARALIKQHNTFYRGISYAPDDVTAMKWASQPRPNVEMYITPHSNVASGYGDPVEVLRPYKLGSDRTLWFTEGNFNITPSAGYRISQGYSGKSGIYAPWVSREPVYTAQGAVFPEPKFPESELVVINTNLIPKRIIHKMPVFSSYIKPNGDYRLSHWYKVGELLSTGSKNLPNMRAEFKQGGSIHIKEKNKGKFTASAKRAGKSVQEHARDVVNDPKATKLQKKRALFALNAKKFKHLDGGIINYINLF